MKPCIVVSFHRHDDPRPANSTALRANVDDSGFLDDFLEIRRRPARIRQPAIDLARFFWERSASSSGTVKPRILHLPG
jgi:hypothetical protein